MTTESPISWDRFREVLVEVTGLAPEAVRPEAVLAELAPTKLARALLWTAISKIGFGLERSCFDAAVTLGDLWEWVQRRRIGTAVTDDVRRPAPGAPVESPVWLRPIRQPDIALLYEAARSPRSAFRWRFRGALPPPGHFVDLLHEGVLVQFVVEAKADRSAQGLVVAYDPVHEYGTCSLAFQRVGPSVVGGEMFLGMFHLIDYVFAHWNMRKLYADMPEYNGSHLGDGFGVLTEEGRLREYVYFDGRFWDRIFYSIDRRRWEELAELARPYLQNGLAPDRHEPMA